MGKYKNIIMTISEEVIGEQKRSKRQPWFNTVVGELALIRRNEVRLGE